MNPQRSLNDEDLAAVFRRRAVRGTADDLAATIVATTAEMPQVHRWPQQLRGLFSGRSRRLLAIAVVGAISVSAVLSVGGEPPQPSEPPVPTAPVPGSLEMVRFARPFSFVLPAGIRIDKTSDRWLTLGDVVPRDGEPPRIEHALDVVVIDGPYIHGCPSGGRTKARDDPLGFFADVETLAGIVWAGERDVTISGYPGRVGDIRGQRCSGDFHVGPGALSDFLRLEPDTRLYALDVDGVTVVIRVWAANPEAWAAWLPTAESIVESIRFEPGPGDPTPEP